MARGLPRQPAIWRIQRVKAPRPTPLADRFPCRWCITATPRNAGKNAAAGGPLRRGRRPVSSASGGLRRCPGVSRASAVWPLTVSDRTFAAAATAASAAAARTSASAWASAWAILVSAILVRRATKSSIRVLASAAIRSASALALATISLGFLHRALALGAVLGDQLLRLVPQLARIVELGLDARRAVIERLGDLLVHAEIDEADHQDDEGDGGPESCIKLHRLNPSAWPSTALFDRLRVGRDAGKPLHDGGGRIGRDRAHVAHRGRAGGGDRFLGIGELGRQPVLERLALLVGLLVQLVADVAADRLRIGAGGRELGFVGLQRGCRIRPSAARPPPCRPRSCPGAMR